MWVSFLCFPSRGAINQPQEEDEVERCGMGVEEECGSQYSLLSLQYRQTMESLSISPQIESLPHTERVGAFMELFNDHYSC